jgi:hypothetical protein
LTDLTDKDVFRLWWEYLKRSDNYRDLCTWHQERRAEPSLPPPKYIRQSTTSINQHPLSFLFRIFLDVNAETYRRQPYSFDIWWKRQGETISQLHAKHKEQPIHDYRDQVLKDMTLVANHLKKNEGKEPGFHDFAGYFAKHLRESIPPKLYLEIDLIGEDTGPIMKMINERIMMEKKNPIIQYWHNFLDRTNWPRDRKAYALLIRYLKVYDLKRKGLKLGQIVQKIGSETQRANYNDDIVQSAFREDLAKAKRIIANVEECRFPGYYGKYSID